MQQAYVCSYTIIISLMIRQSIITNSEILAIYNIASIYVIWHSVMHNKLRSDLLLQSFIRRRLRLQNRLSSPTIDVQHCIPSVASVQVSISSAASRLNYLFHSKYRSLTSCQKFSVATTPNNVNRKLNNV